MSQTTPAVQSDTGQWTPCPRWVFDKLSPSALRVYLAIGYKADRDNVAWPSHQTLAEEAGCSVATVKRGIRECVEAGALRVEARLTDQGDPTSNRYIQYRADPSVVTRGGVMDDLTPPVMGDPRGGVTGDLLTRTSIYLEPTDLERAFVDWYDHYPRKVGRRAAEKAYAAAIKRATPDEILDGLRRSLPNFIQGEARFIPHPATWLNRDGWLDGDDLELEQERLRIARTVAAHNVGLTADPFDSEQTAIGS